MYICVYVFVCGFVCMYVMAPTFQYSPGNLDQKLRNHSSPFHFSLLLFPTPIQMRRKSYWICVQSPATFIYPGLPLPSSSSRPANCLSLFTLELTEIYLPLPSLVLRLNKCMCHHHPGRFIFLRFINFYWMHVSICLYVCIYIV